MFIGVKELERQKLTLDHSFAPGAIDYRTQEFRQVEPLTVQAVAELEGDAIHLAGRFATRLELVCARCLEPVEREVRSRFDLYYRPARKSSAWRRRTLRLVSMSATACSWPMCWLSRCTWHYR